VTTTLRELEVLQLRRDVNETDLLAALRINSSLYKVSLSYHGNIRQFDERWKRRSLAYCQRNQQVPLLLAKPLSNEEALATLNDTVVAQDDTCYSSSNVNDMSVVRRLVTIVRSRRSFKQHIRRPGWSPTRCYKACC
jgi:hypothetical protein